MMKKYKPYTPKTRVMKITLDLSIKKAKNELNQTGYAVLINGHRSEVAMGEPNWFATKREADEYRHEIARGRFA
jgi:hypothetical protein